MDPIIGRKERKLEEEQRPIPDTGVNLLFRYFGARMTTRRSTTIRTRMRTRMSTRIRTRRSTADT